MFLFKNTIFCSNFDWCGSVAVIGWCKVGRHFFTGKPHTYRLADWVSFGCRHFTWLMYACIFSTLHLWGGVVLSKTRTFTDEICGHVYFWRGGAGAGERGRVLRVVTNFQMWQSHPEFRHVCRSTNNEPFGCLLSRMKSETILSHWSFWESTSTSTTSKRLRSGLANAMLMQMSSFGSYFPFGFVAAIIEHLVFSLQTMPA